MLTATPLGVPWAVDAPIPDPRDDPTCAPAVTRGHGPAARGIGYYSGAGAFTVIYTTPAGEEITREGAAADFRVLGFEKDYGPLLQAGGAPTLYVRTTDTRCGEEVLMVPAGAVLGGLVTQAEVDAARANMEKTPEQLGAIRDTLARQPELTRRAHEAARRDGTLLDCIAQNLGLPGSRAEWKCPADTSAWLAALWATPLGKAAVVGGVLLAAAIIVPPTLTLVRALTGRQ